MSLTEVKVRQALAKDKTSFLSDEDGLSLKIDPSGKKLGVIVTQILIQEKDVAFN